MRRLSSVALPLAALLIALGTVACGGPADEATVRDFFSMSATRDPALQGISLVTFDPDTQGTVTNVQVVSSSEERHEPLGLEALNQALEDARTADETFTKQKIEYQNQNMEVIERILKAETGGEQVGPKDAEAQATWTKYRDDTAAYARKVSEARAAVNARERLIELSASTIRNPITASGQSGELVTKDVTVSAPVDMGGQSSDKTLVVTLQRAELAGDNPVVGKWIVTGVREG